MKNRELLKHALTVVKMALRVTPLSAAVDLAQDAAAFNVPKDLEGLFTSATATRAAVARTFSDIDAADRSASDGQLVDMLDACNEAMVLSHALDGAAALEAWLLHEQLVCIPPFLGEAENYFKDQLTVFCHLAAHAAHDPRRPYTHVVLAVARHGSRLDQITSAVADIQDEITLIKAQILGLDSSPEVSISPDDWTALSTLQDDVVGDVKPDVLPEHQRLPELIAAVPGGVAYPLVVLGEGGIGK